MFAITAGAFVPLNFMAVRAATSLVHPRTFDSAGNLPGAMRSAFLVCLIGMTLLYVTLFQYEIAAQADDRPAARAQAPARRRREPARPPLAPPPS